MAKNRNPFGGLKLDFSKYMDVTLKEILPKKRLTPTELTKAVWSWIKKRKKYIVVK